MMKTTKSVVSAWKDGDTNENGVFETGMGLVLGAALLIGLWAFACFASAVFQNGLLGVLRGWLSAVSGA